MALFYIVLAIGVILLNLNRIPSVFVSILEGAFRPSAVTGGIVGSMLMSVKKGVSRGIFSNEAGLVPVRSRTPVPTQKSRSNRVCSVSLRYLLIRS